MNDFEKQLAGQPFKPIPAAWRSQILREARAAAEGAAPGALRLSWLRELFWPCPQAWGALAAVWMVIAVFRFITPGAAPAPVGAVAKGQAISIAEQHRELARLLDGAPGKEDRSPADRPRTARYVPQSCA